MTGPALEQQNGLVSVRSSFTFAKTIESLLVALERRGMDIHARIDHGLGAEGVGLTLGPTQLFVFGYSEAESPVIQRCQSFGIELPQKIIVWEDQDAAVWIAYNDPIRLGQRYSVNADVYPLLQAIGTSLAGIAMDAGGVAGGPKQA